MVDVLCTLPLSDPFPARVTGTATLRVLGHIPISEQLREELRRHPADVLCPQLADRADAAVLEAGSPRLRGVCAYAVGYNYNNVDVDAATARGIAVGNTPEVLTDATADLAMALLLAVARRVVEGDAMMRAGGFTGWEPGFMLGMELRGTMLGIVGLGRIGRAVARRAAAFGMRVGAWGPRLKRDGARDVSDMDVQIFPSLDRLLASSDAVSLHTSLTSETRHLIGERELRRMRPGAILVNTARREVVDEAALVRALREGWIAGAGLDVYDAEPGMAPGLAGCRNAVLTPHLGSATVASRRAMAELTADNALAVLRGELPPRCVNPEVHLRPGPA